MRPSGEADSAPQAGKHRGFRVDLERANVPL
jgi:hypothetical protein